MMDGHIHQVLLEQREGKQYLTVLYGTGLRAECARLSQTKQGALVALTLLPTSIMATQVIAQAFNRGDSFLWQTNPTARTVRHLLLQFLQEHPMEDGRWMVVAENLRRYATLPLCSIW
jgi:hypothetical protein